MDGGVRPTRSLSGDPITDELEACAEILGGVFTATTSRAELQQLFQEDALPAAAGGGHPDAPVDGTAARSPIAGVVALCNVEVDPFEGVEDAKLHIHIAGQTVTVRHLPPLLLSVALPATYPSMTEHPPFRITSNWVRCARGCVWCACT